MAEKYTVRESVLRFAAEQYQTRPEHLWARLPDAAVLRHPNGKWYGLIMQVSKAKLGLPDETACDMLNVRCDPMMLGSVLLQKGFFPAYHMNKNSWITILLDGSVETERITAALRASYALAAWKSSKHRTEPTEWLIPANPKYEDLSKTLAVTGETLWKQSGKFIVGDTVYIYEGKPIGAVTYACTVTEINIPYHYDQGGLHMDTVMRMRLLRCYPQEQFPLVRLQDHGIVSVRGPRHIPADLLEALEQA
ncbi:MAG: MmcQ/YjbR family DNA-binding protein [Oscillospiraceae bacterium]|nr:MmcQ/YjbR family DNA-binding protein [Oscillospiraceae bacterium]